MVGFTTIDAPDKFRVEEGTSLAIILPFRSRRDQFVRRTERCLNLDMQATFFDCLADGGLRGRLAAVLTAARKKEASRRGEDSDFAL